MRQARIKAPTDHPLAYYHCISRVVNRDFILGEREKERFVKMMRGQERFSGIRVVTFCVMSNHFHILVEVPKRPHQMPDDTELLERIAAAGGRGAAANAGQLLESLVKGGSPDAAEALRASYFKRMWDVSFFMKALKQSFSHWYNSKRARKGTLWEERFKSVLVEASGDALATIAAYIDLNPVRAGIVSDPKEYRWCGYAETVAGNKRAKEGIAVIACYLLNRNSARTKAVLAEYRQWLFCQGEEQGSQEDGTPARRGFTREEISEVLAAKGKLTRPELVRCRVRYFVDGCVIGSKQFVDDVFEANRTQFGPKRASGGRAMRGAAPPLYSMRDLQVDVIGEASPKISDAA